MSKISIVAALYAGTHSIQLWGQEWDDVWGCQDGFQHPAQRSFYSIMPTGLPADTTFTEEEYGKKCLGTISHMDTLFIFEKLPKSSQLTVMSIFEAILDREWVPSGMESDKTLHAMGYEPRLAKLAANLQDWTRFQGIE